MHSRSWSGRFSATLLVPFFQRRLSSETIALNLSGSCSLMASSKDSANLDWGSIVGSP